MKEDKGFEQHKMQRLDQCWHDKLYHQAMDAGILHNQACAKREMPMFFFHAAITCSPPIIAAV